MERVSLLSNEWENNDDTERKEIQAPNWRENVDRNIHVATVNNVNDHFISTETADVELKQNIPDLPEGKNRYFFVSYSCEDNAKVLSIVEQLEDRFSLSCVYGDRDFQPGKQIQENIREGMARSLKVLLFLTPNFNESGWCTLEREYAFICSVENRNNCIIPVKLEECQIPTALTPLTYVDATLPRADVPAKIASALIQSGSSESGGFLPREYPSSIKRYENGYSVSISAERQRTFIPCRPAKYKFRRTPELLRKLRSDNIQIPEHLLLQSFKVINNASVMWSYDFLKRCNICCWWIVSLPIVLVACVLAYQARKVAASTRTRLMQEEYNQLEGVNTYIGLCVIVIPIVFLFISCCLPACCHRKQRDISLQRRLWDKFGDEFISSNVILIFSGRSNKKPRILLMRYNFRDCKDYLKAIIAEKYPVPEATYAETYAVSSMKKYVKEILPVLADDFDSLPEASYNRHNVKKGKVCLCQHLEHVI